ncbi:MAG: phosphate ABC transporter substrate-binding protein PstS [Pseudonocardiales bacterium]|nr:phosphate ABC transporter substrate-binding protein PstS [Pseudonocardiales bacterium]
MAAVIAVLALTQALIAPVASGQQGYVPITGSGSTWSFNALDQWRRNVDNLYQIQVQFSPSGSSTGRSDFKAQQVDFAVSEIPYGLTDNGVTEAPPAGRPFAYMPIVAGGTAFMYNLKIGNNRVTNLRLSGQVIAKIFTRVITNWSDPQIKADNPGLTLPARPIVPVVRSDGSGTTAQLTRWMATKFGPIWDAFCGRPNCGFTSNFPTRPGIESRGQSTGVAGFVAQNSSEGAITYVEYSYARNSGFPVAKVLNDGGYYIEPKATSVAVALTQAQIAPDLTQNLDPVYSFKDPRSYPLSSYSYMILPVEPNPPGSRFTPDKGRTLSTFGYYFLCDGQQQADELGYSPLPYNLVQAGVRQLARVPGTTNKLDPNNIRGCRNPTFTPDGSGNALAQTAPQPDPCDKQGATQCTAGTAGARQPTPNNGGGSTGGGSTGGGNTGGGSTGGGSTGGGNTGGGTNNAGATNGGAPVVDPATGEVIGSNDGTSLASNPSAIPVQVDLPGDTQRKVLTVLTVVFLIALVLGPPLASRMLQQRRGGS